MARLHADAAARQAADDLVVVHVDEQRRGEPAVALRERLVEDVGLLDGFPRTLGQAETLEKALDKRGRSLTAALLVDADDETVMKRLSGRRVCTKNGHNYHVDFDPPKNEGVCDQDGSKLVQRDDDKPETVKHRLDVYHDQTQPLIEHYEDKGLLKRFDGQRPPDEVHNHIRATIATMRMEEQV